MIDLAHLADLIRARTAIDTQIAALIGRPAERGHAGECIAAAIFGIMLESSAAHKGSDGHFTAGPLAGKTVNIKWRGVNNGGYALKREAVPDYYLVLTGPPHPPRSSVGQTNPWVIAAVYLFAGQDVMTHLQVQGRRIGPGATSLPRALWAAAEIYPASRNPRLPLTDEQRTLLRLFGPEAILQR